MVTSAWIATLWLHSASFLQEMRSIEYASPICCSVQQNYLTDYKLSSLHFSPNKYDNLFVPGNRCSSKLTFFELCFPEICLFSNRLCPRTNIQDYFSTKRRLIVINNRGVKLNVHSAMCTTMSWLSVFGCSFPLSYEQRLNVACLSISNHWVSLNRIE